MHPGCDIEHVYLCREPIDFRKSINGLSVLVEQALELNPFGSALYVFINRQRNKIKGNRSTKHNLFSAPFRWLNPLHANSMATALQFLRPFGRRASHA